MNPRSSDLHAPSGVGDVLSADSGSPPNGRRLGFGFIDDVDLAFREEGLHDSDEVVGSLPF